MFEIVVRRKFRAGHALHAYRDQDESVHVHDWLIEVKLNSDHLDQSGCAVDFLKVDELLDEVLVPFQEKSLNQVEYFKTISPSAENFAKYLYNNLKDALVLKGVDLMSVNVWEDELHGVIYTEGRS